MGTSHLPLISMIEQLQSHASSRVKWHTQVSSKHTTDGVDFIIICGCGVPIDYIFDLDVQHRPMLMAFRCLWPYILNCSHGNWPSILVQWSCHHDVWLKRMRTKEKKAIVIKNLHSSVNKMKATLLETCVKMIPYEDSNVKLIHDLCFANQSTNLGCTRLLSQYWYRSQCLFGYMHCKWIIRQAIFFGCGSPKPSGTKHGDHVYIFWFVCILLCANGDWTYGLTRRYFPPISIG